MKKIYGKIGKKFFLTFILVCISILGMASTYYVSTSGSDSNTGLSTTSPWKTLTKVNSINFVAGDQILFKRGDVFGDSLVISHSGASGNPITYGAYGTGANPVINGFSTVSAWTNKGNNIWESTNAVSTLSNCNMVTINGVNTAMGRYPKADAANGGYLTFQSYTGTSITSSDLTGTPNWTGAEVVIRTAHWTLERNPVTSQSGSTINVSSIGIFNGSGFFLQNDIRCCTQQNDWYYNPTTKKISIYSTSQPVNVKVAYVEKLVNIYTASYINIANINFIGANGSAIYDRTSNSNISITNCTASNIGVCAFYNNSSNLTIENDSVNDVNCTALGLRSGKNVFVRNNYITNVGLLAGMRTMTYYGTAYGAIQFEDMVLSTIEYNTIKNTGYSGIAFYGDVTTVKNNYIDTYCTLLDDGGGIYTYSGSGRAPMTSAKIVGNICINGIGTPYGTSDRSGAAGIYLDEQSKNVEVYNNSIGNTFMYGIQCNVNAGYINFHDNTVFNGSMHQFFASYAAGADAPTNNYIRKNIFVAKLSSQTSLDYQKCLSFWFDSKNSVDGKMVFVNAHNLDSNYYARPIADSKVVEADGVNYTLAEWKSYSGKEVNSQGSPTSIATTNDIQFLYNETKAVKAITLSQPMIDLKRVKYAGTVTLQPFTSVVLIKDNNPGLLTDADITAFTLPGQTGSSVINATSKTIGITMPYGTSVTSLAASFTLSTGATAKVGTIAQVGGTTLNSYASPVVYVVTAQDGVTTKSWTVTVTVAASLNNQSDVTSFTLPGQVGSSVINTSSKTIGITVPSGTSLTSLVANFTLSAGATAKVGTIVQVSGTTVNSYASPVVYVVTAQDGVTTKNWTVTVTVSASLNNKSDVTSFTLPGQVGASSINTTSKSIIINMPFGASLTNLVATFTLSAGATAKVGTTVQISGASTNNFSTPIVYIITAQDGITVTNWNITTTSKNNAYNLSSSTICQGNVAVIKQDGSQTGINYQLQNSSGTNIGSAIAGTGAAIQFSVKPSSTTSYKVLATSISDGSAILLTNTAMVTVNQIPSSPGMPSGVNSIDIPSVNQYTYSINPVDYADSYTWSIIPSSAGAISGNANSANVNWSESYVGSAYIMVMASNLCGTSSSVQALKITMTKSISTDVPNLDVNKDLWNPEFIDKYPLGEMRIYDIKGRLIRKSKSSLLEFTNDLSVINGIYLYEFLPNNGDKPMKGKLVIVR